MAASTAPFTAPQGRNLSTSAGSLAAQHGVATLAFPSIGTGIYGYPIDLAAELALSTVRAAVDEFSGIHEVIFCCFSADDLAVYEPILNR